MKGRVHVALDTSLRCKFTPAIFVVNYLWLPAKSDTHILRKGKSVPKPRHVGENVTRGHFHLTAKRDKSVMFSAARVGWSIVGAGIELRPVQLDGAPRCIDAGSLKIQKYINK